MQRVLATIPLSTMNWLFAFSVPFMLVAVAIAVLPLVYTMIRDHHSVRNENSSSSGHGSVALDSSHREVARSGKRPPRAGVDGDIGSIVRRRRTVPGRLSIITKAEGDY